MSLLTAMLEKEPDKRISAREAIDHSAFTSVLSKSPLIPRHLFDPDALIKHAKLVE